jgi:hypothetical protein
MWMALPGSVVESAPAAEMAAGSDAFFESLRISGVGMLGVFLVMGLFAALISLLMRWFSRHNDDPSHHGAAGSD